VQSAIIGNEARKRRLKKRFSTAPGAAEGLAETPGFPHR
jgi:hypothetical protein